MARIDSHHYTIDEAFRECFYVVPDYQREYVWQEREVNQLLDDISEQLNGDATHEYFVGTILVAPTGERNHFEVIDGQQRLTTFFLILCALRSRLGPGPQFQALTGLITTSYIDRNGDTKTTLKLDPRYDNAGDAIRAIVDINSNASTVRAAIRHSGVTAFGSVENLLNAYDAIHLYFSQNFKEDAELKRFFGYLATNVVFIQISTDVSSALKIFETINERGVGLNPMDLLKNLLFTHVSHREFSALKDEWTKVTAPLEKAKEKPLRFLRYYVMANYVVKNSRGDGVVREDEIYDWFINKDNAALCGYAIDPFGFVRKVARNVESFISFTDGMGNDGKASPAMRRLAELTGGAFSLHFVLLLAAAPLPKPLFDYFVQQLESFLFYYIFTKTPTRELERSFSRWADQLRSISSLLL
jgi:hypothetical protein